MFTIINFVLQEITAEDVNNVVDSIKSHSTFGKDDLLPKFAKLAKGFLCLYFANLFNKCIDQDIFPFDFKIIYTISFSETLSLKSRDDF